MIFDIRRSLGKSWLMNGDLVNFLYIMETRAGLRDAGGNKILLADRCKVQIKEDHFNFAPCPS